MFKPHIGEVQAAATGTIGAPAMDLYHRDTWNGGWGGNPNYLPPLSFKNDGYLSIM